MDNLLINNRVFLVLLFLSHFNFDAFPQLTENFTDQDLSQNPVWLGDSDDFVTNEDLQLQLSATGAGESFLVTPSAIIESAAWEFFISFDFNPSSQNFAKIYLTSSGENLTEPKNGYYILIGGSNDEISLFKEDKNEIIKIITGRSGLLNTDKSVCKIKANRSSEGRWELWSAVEDTSQFIKEGEVVDLSFRTSSYFGIYFQYTSTRSKNFFFDDLKISGDSFSDTTPPNISSIEPRSATNLSLKFTEPVRLSATIDLYKFNVLPDIGHPEEIMISDDSLDIDLRFKIPMENGKNYALEVNDLIDTAGNRLSYQKILFSFFIPVPVVFRDVVINEIMIDPTPSVGLPEVEYIELYNNSNKTFNLSGWNIIDDQKRGNLGEVFLDPAEYIILCSQADSSILSSYGKICVVSGMPSLNNDGDNLSLEDNSKLPVDQVYYSDAWYKSSIRNSGGYSLELIDFNNPCSSEDNWKASENPDGGTPGRVNSIKANKPDQKGPTLISVFPTIDSLILTFNEVLDPKSVNEAEYYLNDDLIKPLPSLDSRSLIVILNLPFQINSELEYIIAVRNIKDCNGNLISDTSNKVTFRLPETADYLDLVINEILFNPRTGGADFVEIYNNTSKYINLRDWKIANIETERETGIPIISNRKILLEHDYLIAPEKLIAVTTDIADIQKNYPNSRDKEILEVAMLPSFPNEAGCVILINNENNVVDSVNYHEDFHSPILQDNDGVSLERISYDDGSQDPNNWTSASSLVDFATPGAENSQRRNLSFSTATFDITPSVIIPDGNGIDDFVIIEYQMGTQSYNGSVYVYDISGRKVCSLFENKNFASKGFLKWEGMDDHGEPLKIGIYMIFIELYDLAGHIEVFKLPIAVGKNI